MSGISYLGMVCWEAAQQNPPSLKAVVPWESGNDLFFSLFRPGGISNANFLAHWWKNCVMPYQHGRSEGVSEDELQTLRVDFLKCYDWEFRSDGPFPLLGRLRGLDKVKVPFYSSANWMDTEVHAPGNILGYM
jgi:predicted acyl esterase